MNSTKIYACYNMTNDINDLEFWSMNKKLYAEYVAIFGPYMSDADFSHRVLPLSMYDDFKRRNPDCELRIYGINSKKSTPYISTELDLELFDEEGILTEILQLELISSDILKLLPPKIRAAIRKSNYSLYAGGHLCEVDAWRELVDTGKLMTVFQAIRYSNDDIIDPDMFTINGRPSYNPDDMNQGVDISD